MDKEGSDVRIEIGSLGGNSISTRETLPESLAGEPFVPSRVLEYYTSNLQYCIQRVDGNTVTVLVEAAPKDNDVVLNQYLSTDTIRELCRIAWEMHVGQVNPEVYSEYKYGDFESWWTKYVMKNYFMN